MIPESPCTIWYHSWRFHYNDVIMDSMAFQITSLTIVYSAVYSGADQRKHQSSASLAFVRGLHRWFPAQMASNAENVSIWWRHHTWGDAWGPLLHSWTTKDQAHWRSSIVLTFYYFWVKIVGLVEGIYLADFIMLFTHLNGCRGVI